MTADRKGDYGAVYKSGEEVAHAFRSLPPGGSLVYYIGYLAKDRYDSEATESTPLDSVANTVMQFEQEGRAELVQRRVGRYHFEYSIQKRRYIDEEARCDWLSFGSRVRQRDRRKVPVRQLPPHILDLRESFLRRNPHLSAADIAIPWLKKETPNHV